jgi:predicted AlkP superfamily pyrophosphatase or phosphodiesterase
LEALTSDLRTAYQNFLFDSSSSPSNSNCQTDITKKKVLMIGIDGLRADVVGMTPLPNIERLKAWGMHSIWADVQSTAAAVSGPGWVSMFTGVEPSKHLVSGNGDLMDMSYQTVFKYVKDTFGLKLAASVSWHPLVESVINHEDANTLDAYYLASNDNDMAAKAKEWILSEPYDFIFVDFDGPDAAGHSQGFDGYLESYQNRVVATDELIGLLLDAMVTTSAGEEWLIVLTSDHGGEGTSHSAYDKYNRKIPFIVASNSPRVEVGFMPLSDPGSQMDVLPTIMFFLGGEDAVPDGLDGQVFGFKDYTRNPPPPPPGACIPDVNNCGCASEKQADYRGTISKTISGLTCQNWADQSPHSHSRTPANYPSSGLDSNYCRNPDGEEGAWCYTSDPNNRWELCDVPTCDTA